MRAVLAIILCLGLGTPAWAEPVSREELMQALRDRDQTIARLEKRIEVLEHRQKRTASRRAKPNRIAQASAQPPAAPLRQSTPAAQVAQDEDTALQALSRTLVARGALVLPKWSVEIVPGIEFSHSQTEGLALVATPEGLSTVANQRRKDEGVRGTVTARLGLPWDSQIELRIPYAWARSTTVLGDGTVNTETDNDLGDIELELSHQFLREGHSRPDLLGAVSWRAPTGPDPFRGTAVPGIVAGGGVSEIKGRLTAVKSSDPMVFFATLSYASSFAASESIGRIHPGPDFGLSLGAILSVSPETSLTVAFSQDYIGKTSLDDADVSGSDRMPAVVQLGLDYVLAPNILLDVSLGLGVTGDAPDYDLLLAMPVRFQP